MDYRSEAPPVLRDFLSYHETIKGHSRATVDEYFLDLRNFFRYLKIERGLVPRSTELDDISIQDVDLKLIASVTLNDVYDYMAFLSRDKVKNERSHEPEYGLMASSRARKIATIRSFYKYLTVKTKQLDVNPVEGLDTPKTTKSLPRYLTLDESRRLLDAVDGVNRERDYCIICLFLNCGLRISEIVGLNIGDVRGDSLRVLGKGNKERIVYLNDACQAAIEAYKPVRSQTVGSSVSALLSRTAASAWAERLCTPWSKRPCSRPGWTRTSIHRTSCGTRRRRSCCKTAWTCAPCRRSWATST